MLCLAGWLKQHSGVLASEHVYTLCLLITVTKECPLPEFSLAASRANFTKFGWSHRLSGVRWLEPEPYYSGLMWKNHASECMIHPGDSLVGQPTMFLSILGGYSKNDELETSKSAVANSFSCRAECMAKISRSGASGRRGFPGCVIYIDWCYTREP